MSGRWKKWVLLALLAMAGMGAAVAWWRLRPAPVPPGFALANGRIEATPSFHTHASGGGLQGDPICVPVRFLDGKLSLCSPG